ncbi:unnamed protein product [Mytilus coruscus]|uniref:SIPAR domain-containing protein n=1 Tax=Mytilus coruscus TaxID=42192 RepID=A0A6J8D0N3_MYTCO|nr:unnamed protein product [Mytilus coruscus]
MSRGVRDLRDLICVSRLTVRDSDEEFISDDDNVTNDFDRLSLGSTDSSDSRNESGKRFSPDSGCVTNGETPPEVSNSLEVPLSTSLDLSRCDSKPKRKRKKKQKVLHTVPYRHDLPQKHMPLPPLRPSSSFDVDISSQPIGVSQSPKQTNFDNMMCYMDATVVSAWLTRANESVEKLSSFCNIGDNFVRFAHFWLSDFPGVEKQEIFELENGILTEELSFAFTVGREQRKINYRDVLDLSKAVFREYPSRLLSSKGSHIFLDYLGVLTSGKKEDYKKMLSDVKCSTRNKQYAQWLLAIRSFAIVSCWSAIVNFYRNLIDRLHHSNPISYSSNQDNEDIHQVRLCQAIRLGFVDVVHYYNVSGHVSLKSIDSHDRTTIFTAVMHNQPDVLQYLINRVNPKINVNQAADTGNSPLHAAANNGNTEMVTILVKSPDINVNITNPQCENATAIHLAVMHGHKDVVKLLILANADLSLKMGDLTAVDIARDFGHSELLELFQT